MLQEIDFSVTEADLLVDVVKKFSVFQYNKRAFKIIAGQGGKR